ncbi:cytidylate kinase family protein [Caproiciproducens sp.]|uniref:cytidylate kinase family protein n=1 Tax=Caproiciproducens sp. TaxID=1954376 RepID=UPI00289DC7B0|nr:cytidylate kinase family protein [Caproiciproducens sp.]
MVGRCADDVLKDRDDLLKVFIFADIEVRKKRAISEYGDVGIDGAVAAIEAAYLSKGIN